MKTLSRRAFIKTTAVAAVGASLSVRSWARVIGANDKVRVAVVGLNGRGQTHLEYLSAIPDARVVAICDADTAVLARTIKKVGPDVRVFTDIRELLASPDIDAITVATPNHWHSLMGIWACQAGKDAYVEKPVSHNVWEGRQLLTAAAKYGRVVVGGMQIRSGDGMVEAVEWVRAGNLGKIKLARGLCYKRRPSIGLTVGPQPVPDTVNYNLWCGPSPLAPLRRKKLHYDWHWQWPTGSGDIGNQGVHQVDVARWFLGESGFPRHVLSVGGRLGYKDDGETPNTQAIWYDYASAPMIFEVRGLPKKAGDTTAAPAGLGGAEAAAAMANSMDRYRGIDIGNVIDCEGGSLLTDGYFAAKAVDRDGKVIREFKGEDRNMANFISVVRSRKMSELRAPITEAHVSSALCHLGNISHRVGHTAKIGEIQDAVRESPPLAETVDRVREHLAANKIDLEITPLTLGAPLAIDVAAEKFTGAMSDRANPLLTREYRAPFVVPRLA
ncbi:MAG TPA: Gfo/Idh/MocA family oxidoreductase [Candidatus Didemnitutus sp.]|nr:Gfo/Idh/MocA family oxidoreductase [Candidatus Didemnitutus sp.]